MKRLWTNYCSWLDDFTPGELAIFILLLLGIGLCAAIYVWGIK